MNRRLEYRMYPTVRQEAKLLDALGLHQRLYNAALEQRISAFKRCGISLSFYDQARDLTELRRSDELYRDFNAQSEQETLKRLHKAFQNFFGRVRRGETPGFPRFKAFDRYSGWGYPSHGDGWRLKNQKDKKRKMANGKLFLSKIGDIRIRGSARTAGTPKTCDIIRRHGKWYASIVIECQPQRAKGTQAAGMDWGVETFATLALNNGSYQEIENPRNGRKVASKLAKEQKDLTRKRKGSNRRNKQKQNVARVHQKLKNIRKNFIHQTTNQLVSELALVATEELNIKSMTAKRGQRKKGLNREILDTSPGTFVSNMRYKAEEADIKWIDVPTKEVKPSQTCSACGRQEKKPLSARRHVCPCGHTNRRDREAAKVMLDWALKSFALESPGWEPTESWRAKEPVEARIPAHSRQAWAG